MKSIKNADGTITLIPEGGEVTTLARVLQTYGQNVLAELVVNWLTDRSRVFEEQDKTAFKAKFDALPDADKDLIMAKLNAVIYPLAPEK